MSIPFGSAKSLGSKFTPFFDKLDSVKSSQSVNNSSLRALRIKEQLVSKNFDVEKSEKEPFSNSKSNLSNPSQPHFSNKIRDFDEDSRTAILQSRDNSENQVSFELIVFRMAIQLIVLFVRNKFTEI